MFLKPFAEMSCQSPEYQGHGWGISYLDQSSTWQQKKYITPIWEHTDTMESLGRARVFLAHARSAFQDKDIVIENNMPFTDDRFIFIFNGELRGVRIAIPGRIGAEKIFNQIKRFYHGNLYDAVYRTYSLIKKRTNYIRALNLIIYDMHTDTGVAGSLFSTEPAYFTMAAHHSDTKHIICSQPLPSLDMDWTSIDNDSIQEIFLSDSR